MKYTRKSFSVVAGGTDEYRAGYDAIDWGNGDSKKRVEEPKTRCFKCQYFLAPCCESDTLCCVCQSMHP